MVAKGIEDEAEGRSKWSMSASNRFIGINVFGGARGWSWQREMGRSSVVNRNIGF